MPKLGLPATMVHVQGVSHPSVQEHLHHQEALLQIGRHVQEELEQGVLVISDDLQIHRLPNGLCQEAHHVITKHSLTLHYVKQLLVHFKFCCAELL